LFQGGFAGSPKWFRRHDEAAIKARADLLAMDRSEQADLTAKGMTFNKPDPVRFRAALVKAGFYTQWQKTYGSEAWARLGTVYRAADVRGFTPPA
jgi:TRAP-type C4-dicarboxylate transport system substrate-binding protein